MKLGNNLLKAAMLSTISIASLSVGSAAFAQDNTPQAKKTQSQDTTTKRQDKITQYSTAQHNTIQPQDKMRQHNTIQNKTRQDAIR